jgi:hypothetical protein
MKFSTQTEAFKYINQLQQKFEKAGQLEAANFLNHYLMGIGSAFSGEMAENMVDGVKEFVKQFRHLLTLDEIKNLQEAREAYARHNDMNGIGDIE